MKKIKTNFGGKDGWTNLVQIWYGKCLAPGNFLDYFCVAIAEVHINA